MTTTNTISISYDTLQDIIASHLYAISYVDDDVDILDVDLGLEINSLGLIEVEMTTQKRKG